MIKKKFKMNSVTPLKKFFRSKIYTYALVIFGIIILLTSSLLVLQMGVNMLTKLVITVLFTVFILALIPLIYFRHTEREGNKNEQPPLTDSTGKTLKKNIKKLILLYFLLGFVLKLILELLYLLIKNNFLSNPYNFLIAFTGTILLYHFYRKEDDTSEKKK